MRSGLVTAVALTPIRAGAGQSPTPVDLPLARERHTGIPYVPASGLKGALRDRVRILLAGTTRKGGGGPVGLARADDVLKELMEDGDVLERASDRLGERLEGALVEVFGTPAPPREAGLVRGEPERQGALALHDLVPVLLPARAVYPEGPEGSPWVWVTCPYLLRAASLGLGDRDRWEPRPDLGSLSEGLRDGPLAPEGSALVGVRILLDGPVELEPHGSEELARFLRVFAQRLPEVRPVDAWVERWVVLVDDATFSRLVDRWCPLGTEVRTRVRLRWSSENLEKVVEEGALWTEEFLPRLTVLAGPYRVLREPEDDRVWEVLREDLEVPVGAAESAGFGLLRLRFFPPPPSG